MLNQSQERECTNIEYYELQKKCGLSNSQAADYLGVNISTIKRMRNGKIKPKKTVMIAMMAYLNSLNDNHKE